MAILAGWASASIRGRSKVRVLPASMARTAARAVRFQGIFRNAQLYNQLLTLLPDRGLSGIPPVPMAPTLFL
jgi:hypothetical protein